MDHRRVPVTLFWEVTDGRRSRAPPVGCWNPVPLSLALAFPLRPHCSDLLAPRKAGQTSRESKGCFTTSPLAC